MAIYHLSVRNISRKSGSSSIAALSYILGEPVKDERLGKTAYEHKNVDNIMMSKTLLPEGAPEEYKDPKKLFNAIETYEKNSAARTAKRIIVALPNELDLKQNEELLDGFCKNVTDMGYACTYAVHYDPYDRNHHAHLLVANRQIDKTTGEWAKTKSKKVYVLDKDGNRVPVIDPKTGEQKVDSRNRKQWQRRTVTEQPLDRKETLQNLRKEWASECNRYLAPEQQISEKSLKDQGITRIPTIHEGPTARAIMRRTGTSERTETNLDIFDANEQISVMEKAIIRIAEIIRELLAALEIMIRPELRADKEAMAAENAFKIDTNYGYDEDAAIIEKKDTGHDELYNAAMGIKNMLLEVPDMERVPMQIDATEEEKKIAEAVVDSVKEGISAHLSDDKIADGVRTVLQRERERMEREQEQKKKKRIYRDDEPEL